jgi:hypothetical protein
MSDFLSAAGTSLCHPVRSFPLKSETGFASSAKRDPTERRPERKILDFIMI